MAGLRYRPRDLLPKLGRVAPRGPVLLDTNVFIAAFSGRPAAALATLLANLPLSFVSGPVVAELSWVRGRLDPAHPQTAKVLALLDAALAQISPLKILVPTPDEWARAGALAGTAARGIAGGGTSIRTAFDRTELLNDAVSAIVARRAGATIITSDGDFDLFAQLEPELDILFYD